MPCDFVEGLAEIDDRAARVGYAALAPWERDLYDVNRFHFEVCCGGLGVFFENSAGAHWRETIGALGRVGALGSEAVLKQACALFPTGEPPAERRALFDATRALSRQIRALGSQIDDNELFDALEAYWKAHNPDT